MNKSLLDTDILSEIGKGIDPNVIRNATAYRANFPSYTISTITVMEVVRGLQKKQSLARVQQFVANLVGVEILPFDLPAAELAGRISGDLDRMGQTIGRLTP